MPPGPEPTDNNHNEPDGGALLDALDAEADALARHAFEVFSRYLPEARSWPESKRDGFVTQARGRLSAVLAIVEQGEEVGEALRNDLEAVGANAAKTGQSLPHLLLVLRISRDLLLRSAIRFCEKQNGDWDPVANDFTGELLTTIDRLTDALSRGFWLSKLAQISAERRVMADIYENLPFGVYEADLDGILAYANRPLAQIVGRPDVDLSGWSLADVFQSIDNSGAVAALFSESTHRQQQVTLQVSGPGGQPVALLIDTVVRHGDDGVEGFIGVVRVQDPSTSKADFEPMIKRLTELRRALDVLADGGTFLTNHASELNSDQVAHGGASITRQVERLRVVVEQLETDRRAIEAASSSN